MTASSVKKDGGPDLRSVIDPEIQAETEKLKNLSKEAAVKHKRHWVRLTRLCNQRCIFCLDSWNQNGTYVDTQQLYQYIDLGANLGSERLILSGGEPTIHPDYVKFIKRGRAAGYDWIQTVTNGMMFAYPEFTRKCIRAGLDEVTVSIHGHTPKIQDRLTGVKGAFDKGVQGIRNIQALSGGRTVVNVDIVINKQNIGHLREIIDYFMAMGIHEFDLLYIVPFGRGFSEYRKQLYFNIEDHYEDLQRALEVSKRPGVFIWTNRLPPEYLENYEELIQDPHKLHSEVQGGLHNFEGYMKLGIAPDCHGERCQYCFLKGLCHDHMFEYRQMLVDGTFKRVRFDLQEEELSQRASLVLASQKPKILHVQGESAEGIREWMSAHPFQSQEALRVHVEPRIDSDVNEFVEDSSIHRVLVTSADKAIELMGTPPSSKSGPALEVTLTKQISDWMLDNVAETETWREAKRLVLHLPSFEYMSGVQENGVGPAELKALGEAGYVLMNVTQCLGGSEAQEGVRDELSNEMLDAQGNLGVTPYVQRYIMGEYFKKSRRCDGCALVESCRGMHISFLRAFGFSSLTPLSTQADEEAA
jgi:MoaA/NifB/PqqE/SkfB family radical SAM enzyme